jgi:hypothetical protein
VKTGLFSAFSKVLALPPLSAFDLLESTADPEKRLENDKLDAKSPATVRLALSVPVACNTGWIAAGKLGSASNAADCSSNNV